MLANLGWVSVGISADTSEFAVESLRRWRMSSMGWVLLVAMLRGRRLGNAELHGQRQSTADADTSRQVRACHSWCGNGWPTGATCAGTGLRSTTGSGCHPNVASSTANPML
ncbi:MAG: hypothetical protein EXR79_01585 [Myxococcales bacterium]|nr:hypothetical protein [Myxococcales bacterium]